MDIPGWVGGLIVGFPAGVGALLAVLRWREQHARPVVSVWVGQQRDDVNDPGRFVVLATFANRGHDRELVLFQFEVPRANAAIDHTIWKGAELVKAGSTRLVPVSVERLRGQIGIYIPNASTRDLARAMTDIRAVLVTGDGERHIARLKAQNKQRMQAWIAERATARRTVLP